MNKLTALQEELYRLFSIFNQRYYDNTLSRPIIVVQSNGKSQRSMGWCTNQKVWKDNDTQQTFYEIVVCAEYLFRDVEEICATFLHELVHLYCNQYQLKDTSRGYTYHNKVFKRVAEQHGLVITYDSRIGWSPTKLKETEIEFVRNTVNESVFVMTRKTHKRIPEQPKKKDPETPEPVPGDGDGEDTSTRPKSSTRKYICPECKTIVRATKEVNIICGDCNVPFEKNEH